MRLLCLILVICLFLYCGKPETPQAEAAPASTSAAAPLVFPEPEAFAKAALAIQTEQILAGVKFLSDDALEGRATGTEGERKAANWIADRFKASGLVPMAGDSFLQPVNLVGFQKDAAGSSLSMKGPDGEIALKSGETVTYWSSSQKPEVQMSEADLLFVGYGVEAPEHQWDDFKGVDCKGKILVFLNNDPQTDVASEFGGPARTYYGRYTYKYEKAMAKGALGGIVIHTTPSAGYGWNVISDSGDRENFALKLPGSGYQLDLLAWIHEDVAGLLAKSVGESLDSWIAKAAKRDFQPVLLPVKLNATIKTLIRETTSQNVVGVWEGSDPVLKDQILVFSAHYDHLGMDTTKEGDQVYNGAWDNGLGTSCITEIAAAFGASGLRPKRSIAFLACTGEEKGILGSQWFVANPPVARKRIVGNINIDMPQIFGLTKDVVCIGHDTNSMGDLLKAMTEAQQVTLLGDQEPNAGKFYRSDQVSFAKAGIPAIYLLPGKEYVAAATTDPEAYHEAHYHQLSDEINEMWNLAGCERDMRLYFQLAASIAMADKQPQWHAGNEFEEAWKKLYGL